MRSPLPFSALAAVLVLWAASAAIAQQPATVVPSDENYKAHYPWNQECEVRVAAMKGHPCDVIFIGDSITQNFVETPNAAWPLAGRQIWDKYYGNRNVLNFGVGADKTQHVLWRMDHMDIKDFKPRVAVILIGINNADDTAQDIASGIVAVVQKTRAVFPGARIILMSILRSYRFPDKIAEVNRLSESLADNEKIFYFDLASRMTPIGDSWKGVGFDHLHLAPEGYELWASSMDPLLTRLLDMPPLGY
jgi:lysophospholipase L1-like esterase